MVKYHINSDGNVKKCSAKPGNCPLGGEHFNDEDTARNAAEAILSVRHPDIPKTSKNRLQRAVDRYGAIVEPLEIPLPEKVDEMLENLRKDGLNPLLVGGSVRDQLLDLDSKDLDFEVYGGTIDDVIDSASRIGRVDEVGKEFGVLKMTLSDGSDIDLSVPRRENKTGAGYRGFEVEVDSTLTVSEAAERRDFTINAMSYDPELKVLIDPYNGKQDLEQKTLRHVSEKFGEDPLRVLRGMQFAARFDMDMDENTIKMCQKLEKEFDSISDERIQIEFQKLLDKGVSPAKGLQVLKETGWDKKFPGLAEVNNEVLQERLNHSKTVSAIYEVESQIILSSVIIEKMSKKDAENFVKKTVEGKDKQKKIMALSRNKDLPSTVEEARLMALRDSKENIAFIDKIAFLDSIDQRTARARRIIQEAGVLYKPEKDLLMGRDVIQMTDRKPDKWLGELLSKARTAQATSVFRDKESAITWAENELKSI